MSWLTVAPFSAARVAPALRNPCADPGQPATRAASRNQLPKDSFTIGVPFSFTRKVRSPVFDAAIVAARPGEPADIRRHHRGFFHAKCNMAVLHMLAAKTHDVAAGKSCVQQRSSARRSLVPIGQR